MVIVWFFDDGIDRPAKSKSDCGSTQRYIISCREMCILRNSLRQETFVDFRIAVWSHTGTVTELSLSFLFFHGMSTETGYRGINEEEFCFICFWIPLSTSRQKFYPKRICPAGMDIPVHHQNPRSYWKRIQTLGDIYAIIVHRTNLMRQNQRKVSFVHKRKRNNINVWIKFC